MLVVLTLLALAACSLPPAIQPECGDECAVLEAALEWAVAQVPEENRARTFLDVGKARSPPTGEETPEIRAQNRVLIEAAARLGIPAVRREEDDLRCREASDSATCPTGTTWIVVRRPQLVSQGEALAAVSTTSKSEPEFRCMFHGNQKEARLRRIDGIWQVVGSRVVLWAC